MAAIGRPELADDPAYATNGARCANRDALDAAIAAWTQTLPAKEAEALLEAADVPCSRLFDIADCATDPHFRRAQVGAGGGGSADRAHAASGADDPAGRGCAGGGGGVARPGGRRAHGLCAADAAGAART